MDDQGRIQNDPSNDCDLTIDNRISGLLDNRFRSNRQPNCDSALRLAKLDQRPTRQSAKARDARVDKRTRSESMTRIASACDLLYWSVKALPSSASDVEGRQLSNLIGPQSNRQSVGARIASTDSCSPRARAIDTACCMRCGTHRSIRLIHPDRSGTRRASSAVRP
jgi:hypothetical protein